jgi:hypothetical protein
MTTEIEELLKPLRLAVAEQVRIKFLLFSEILELFYLKIKGRFSQETES